MWMCRESLRNYLPKNALSYSGGLLVGWNSKSIPSCWLAHSLLQGIKIWSLIPNIIFHKGNEPMYLRCRTLQIERLRGDAKGGSAAFSSS